MAVYLEDKKLVGHLLAGDARAFDRFYDENFARLYRFALARVSGDHEGAMEITQSTLTRAIRKLLTYRAESALFTWLCAICRNELADWLGRQGRYRDHIVLTEDFPEVRAAVDSYQAPDADQPDAVYQRVESLRLIQVALDQLPARYGDVLEWKYVEGRSVKEISARLKIGQEATQSLLARAKHAFADVYTSLVEAMSDHADEVMRT
jgi:RNA polymerase sigma-70 factor (ECF subfamily)